ncbi:unnamed protein product [Hydatigera taeniaeformis]|uniref:Rad60-SLD domain-containing protein n=1 Tax=Hydatigena taeniaeformis TaxID=6205 RepID=A0A0R3WL10_HYDTA|nr:unnamed protein product [Hydatigera taeniaeformis]
MGDDNAPKEKNNEPINLTVHGQDGSVIHFKIKRTTPFKKLMNAYCQRLLDLHDNDTIEVFQTQTGGY